jgi:hypothetical protein
MSTSTVRHACRPTPTPGAATVMIDHTDTCTNPTPVIIADAVTGRSTIDNCSPSIPLAPRDVSICVT